MLKDVVVVKPLENYQLYLRFEDDVEGVVNVSEIVEFTGVFAALENQEYFETVKVNPDWGTVYWDCGADLDPDVLYSKVTSQAIPNYQVEEKRQPINYRYYFSVEALVSAYHSANKSLSINNEIIEKIEKREKIEEIDISYTSSVMNAVINSVMFMEISINEFFEDVSITNLDDFKAPSLLDIDKIGKDAVKRIKYFLEIDKNFLKRESILDKYNLALLLCEKSTLKKNEEPYQSANLLVGFRNDLVYHKLKANETNLERSLSNKFNLHAKSEKEPYYYPYPKNHLSHECAKWAVSSSRKFVEEFFEKVGITPVYLKEIAQLSRLLEFK